MKATSDQQYLALAMRRNTAEEFVLYKAAIAVANIGSTHTQEKELSECEMALLEVRRKIYRQEFVKADALLSEIKTDHHLLEADKHFLRGQIFHRTGQQQKACELMQHAGDLYSLAGEPYRELRARVNGAICLSTLDSCLFGELFSYEQEARRQGFMDLAANICRTRAMKLLIEGRLLESHNASMESAQLYMLDGYPDDRAVALVTGAIALAMNNENERAQEIISLCHIKEGKVRQYLDIFETVMAGKIPKLNAGHPLFDVKWKKNSLKKESVPGKLVNLLKEGPKSKDALITGVWGDNANDISYIARLHTAINYLRKTKGIVVSFDGEAYSLGAS